MKEKTCGDQITKQSDLRKTTSINNERQFMKNVSREDRIKEARYFLNALFYPLGEDEQIEIRYRSKDPAKPRMHQKFVEDIEIASCLSAILGKDYEVYFGVGTRLGGLGTKAGVSKLSALWGDFDIKAGASEDEILQKLASLEFPPSMIVHSGGGLHTYWKLEKPATSEDDLQEAEAIMKSIARACGGDPVWDRSRILRIPGTFNHKEVSSRPVVLRSSSGSEYSLAQLSDMATGLSPAPHIKADPSSGVVGKDALGLQIEAGGRNLTLTSVAGSLRSRGLDRNIISDVLDVVNVRRCSPPLPEDEVDRIAGSVAKYKAGTPRYKTSFVKRIFGQGGGS